MKNGSESHNDLIKKLSAFLVLREPEKDISGYANESSFDFSIKMEDSFIPLFSLNYTKEKMVVFPAFDYLLSETTISLIRATAKKFGFSCY